MNWHTANKRKRRALARSRRRFIVPFHQVLKQMLKPAFFEVGWQEWLNKLLPTLLNENSVAARILMRKPEPTPTWKTQLPRLSPFRGTKTNIEALRKAVNA